MHLNVLNPCTDGQIDARCESTHQHRRDDEQHSLCHQNIFPKNSPASHTPPDSPTLVRGADGDTLCGVHLSSAAGLSQRNRYSPQQGCSVMKRRHWEKKIRGACCMTNLGHFVSLSSVLISWCWLQIWMQVFTVFQVNASHLFKEKSHHYSLSLKLWELEQTI